MNLHIGPGSTAAVLVGLASVAAQSSTLDPARLRRVGQVDERFRPYNVEMVEVTGGRFWAPYSTHGDRMRRRRTRRRRAAPGIDPGLFRVRRPSNWPIDIRHRR